ncbi:MAG: response regulator transcription factor [Chitinophagaceae bacterium]|nr:response regulator transcription factor [Chitinophagaceae bacterium]MCW5929522.1 response regulator transcription factor [Chitinophagaceae bacterium]
MNAFIIEDEELLQEEISAYLTERGFNCEAASTYEKAERNISLFDYDIVILDITLPGGNGIELLKKMKREKKDTGIVIISARDSLTDKLSGLDLGADDYITKPFYMEELNARINAILRRRSLGINDIIRIDDLEVDTNAKTVFHGKTEITLTKKEYELLLYFIINKNRVVSKQSILAHLWGDEYADSESIDTIYVHTMNLRKKLVSHTGIDYIKTVYGMGYKWVQG